MEAKDLEMDNMKQRLWKLETVRIEKVFGGNITAHWRRAYPSLFTILFKVELFIADDDNAE